MKLVFNWIGFAAGIGLSMTVFAATSPGPAVAVVPFTGNTADPNIPRSLSELISVDIIPAIEQCDGVAVEWARRDDVIAEIALGESGLVDPDTAAAPGHLIDPTVFITGVVTGEGQSSSWKIQAKSALTGALIAEDEGTALNNDLFDVTEGITQRLVQKVCEAPRQDPCGDPGATATLTARYSFTNSGRESTSSQEEEWSSSREAVVTSHLVAVPSSPFPAMISDDGSQAGGTESLAAQSMPADVQAMMKGAEAAAAKCGDDEACMIREMMQMVGMPGATPGTASANAAAVVLPEARYQRWNTVAEEGQYQITETYSLRAADPLCLHRTDLICTRSEQREGSGALAMIGDGQTAEREIGPGTAEMDCAAGILSVMLPVWVNVPEVTQTIETDHPERQDENGSTVIISLFRAPDPGILTAPTHGAVRAVSGTYTLDAEDDAGRPGELTVDWQFKLR